jgi:uncharacterized membrane protein YhaH (DUF805 family)
MNGELLAVIAGMILVLSVVFIAFYIYLGFAFMAIGKRAKLKNPGLAWIPGVGPLIIAFQIAKMPWWPWLLLIGVFIPAIGGLFSLAFTVFAVMWHWKMFEKLKRPGWWAILALIPVLNLVLYGITAWGKTKK